MDWLDGLERLVTSGPAAAVPTHWGNGKLNAVFDAEETARGIRIFVKSVVPGGAAEAAGIQPGDTLKSWTGHHLDRPATFWRHAWRGKGGDRVLLELEREGRPVAVETTLQPPAPGPSKHSFLHNSAKDLTTLR